MIMAGIKRKNNSNGREIECVVTDKQLDSDSYEANGLKLSRWTGQLLKTSPLSLKHEMRFN